MNLELSMAPELEDLLNPGLCQKTPLFTSPLTLPRKGEKVYELTADQLNSIRRLREGIVDLHPGMGGVAPGKLMNMIADGIELTSVDYMLTRGCNFSCTWCFAGSSPGERDYLPFATLHRLTEEAVSLGTSLFILTGGEPLVYRDRELDLPSKDGGHLFAVIDMILETARRHAKDVKILVFDDVALINQKIARGFADRRVGLCTKADTLISELQDYKVNQRRAFNKMQRGYGHLRDAGYGTDPDLRVVVNSVLDHTTFDGMIDLHDWVMRCGFDHSIVPVHYCGNAIDEDQEAGIHSLHVKVLYDLISRIDRDRFDVNWRPWSAFPYNKTCNRNRSGLHIRANGDVTACSESPDSDETPLYTFGNALDPEFSLVQTVKDQRLRNYRREFARGEGDYICSSERCDLYANELCQGGCATRSAYSQMDFETGLIQRNDNPERYSKKREDPLCPAWTELAIRQGILRDGLLRETFDRLVRNSRSITGDAYPWLG